MSHKTATNLNILAWNCQSIRNKLSELNHHLIESNIDIAVLCETWLSTHQNIFLQGYTVHRRDRQNGEHGGVAIAIKNSIEHSLLPNIETHVIEAVAVKVHNQHNQHITIISCYFPGASSSQAQEQFVKDLRYLTSLTTASYFLIGDFNSKHRLWNNVRANATGTKLYNEMSRNNFVILHPPTPTYHPPQARASNPSTIDITITNNVHTTSQLNSISSLSSDHNAVEFIIFTESIRKTNSILRFDLANWKNFQAHISQHIDLHTAINDEVDINLAITSLSENIRQAIELHVPRRKQTTDDTKLSRSIIEKITIRNTVRRRQWQRTRNHFLRITVNKLTREIQKDCRNHRNKLFHKKLEKLDASPKKILASHKNC